MTSSSPDPQPEDSTGLELGGGASPGETPPGEASTTAGVPERQPDVPSGRSNAVVYGVVLTLVSVVMLLVLGYAIGLVG